MRQTSPHLSSLRKERDSPKMVSKSSGEPWIQLQRVRRAPGFETSAASEEGGRQRHGELACHMLSWCFLPPLPPGLMLLPDVLILRLLQEAAPGHLENTLWVFVPLCYLALVTLVLGLLPRIFLGYSMPHVL